MQGYKERCQNLELELEVKGKNTKNSESTKDMEFEIKKVRDTLTKQTSQLKEEKHRLQAQLQDAQASLKSYSSDPTYLNHQNDIS